jgi:hypothetical protein
MSYDDLLHHVEVRGSYPDACHRILRYFVFLARLCSLPLTDATAKLQPSRRITHSARRVERERLRRVDVAVAVQRR